MKYFPLVILLSIPLFAQMPDWKFFRDREGNTWYYNRAGKIMLTDDSLHGFQPVNSSSIDYYVARMKQFALEGKPVEALRIAQALLWLPGGNTRLTGASQQARKIIEYLNRKHGSRMVLYRHRASLYLVKHDDTASAVNELMRYSLSYRGKLSVYRFASRTGNHYLYQGVTLALSGRSETGKHADYLVSIDSEKTRSPATSVQDLLLQRKISRGASVTDQEVVSIDKHQAITAFTSSDRKYGGYETASVSGHYQYLVRIIAPYRTYRSRSQEMLDIIKSLRIVTE